jgi:hypothetical protein
LNSMINHFHVSQRCVIFERGYKWSREMILNRFAPFCGLELIGDNCGYYFCCDFGPWESNQNIFRLITFEGNPRNFHWNATSNLQNRLAETSA